MFYFIKPCYQPTLLSNSILKFNYVRAKLQYKLYEIQFDGFSMHVAYIKEKTQYSTYMN